MPAKKLAKAVKTGPNPIDNHVGSRVRMRRLVLGLSQEKVAHALGLTFQQVQKYEKGTNRISSSRPHQLAGILDVPIPFFFDGAPQQSARSQGKAESPNYVNDFLATDDGLTLTRAFMSIEDANLRRRIVHLEEQLASGD
jgi:transcriptional regulator with XRE-family HTH domain